MSTPDRDALLTAARAGDPAAREQLLTAHVDTVRAVCGSRLRSPHDVADATQETFVRALAHLDQVRDADTVDAWLRAIAVRVCADHGRRHVRSVPVADPAGDAPCGRPGPPELAVAREDASRLHASLATLGPRDRQALWLRDAVGVPVAHIAADLGVTEGSARVLLARARDRLRAAYQGVAGIAAVGLLRLRGRLADAGPIDPRVVLAAQLTIVAVAVGAAVPAAPAPASGGGSAAGPVATSEEVTVVRTSGARRTVPAPTGERPGATTGQGPATPRSADAGAEAAPSVVAVGAERPTGPSRVGIAASDGDGGVAGIELWGGPVDDALGDDGAAEAHPDDDGEASDGLPLGPVEVVPGGPDARD